MKAKKCLSLVLVAGCLCLSAIGCSNNNDSKVKENNNRTIESSVSYNSNTAEYFKIMPSALTDEYIICVNNMNTEIAKDWTMAPYFTFNILSKEPLTEGDVSVNIDTNTLYDVTYSHTVEAKGKFADYICCLYNNIDLSKMSDSKIAEEYDSLTDEQFPQFYNNTYTVSFNTYFINQAETINKMEVTVKGKTYNVDLGNIQFVEYPEKNVGDWDLAFNSIGCAGNLPDNNKDGIISVPPRDAEVNKDIKIKDIRLANKSDTISINKVDIDLTSDDKTVSKEWKKSTDLEIKKGTDLTFHFEIKDTKFAENPNYAVNIYILVEYEADGKTYVASTQASHKSEFDSQTLYAMYKDNVDFSPYFNR